MDNLKDYREKELKAYVLLNILVLISIVYSSEIVNSMSDIKNIEIIVKVVNISIISTIMYIFVYIIDSVFSSSIKYTLVYLKIFRLPGETIFTDIKSGKCEDIRFTKESVEEIYNDIYSNMPANQSDKYKYENSKWYSIYYKCKDISMIFISNKDFLLFRDMNVSTIAILILYVLVSCIFKVIIFDVRYVIYLIFMIIVTNVITRSKGKRFACNVIAHDLSK